MVIKHRTLDGLVADEVRERIVSGALPGGMRIDQQALAEELGVSRMPVREALRQLAAEGFVVLVSHRGAIVAQLSPSEIIELYEMRGVLQGLAARLAVPNYGEKDLNELQRLLDLMEKTKDVRKWTKLNHGFHSRMEAPSGAQHLLGLIQRLTQQCEPYMQISVQYLHAEELAGEGHHAIFEACQARDADGLEQAVRSHLTSWGREVASYIERRAEPPEQPEPGSNGGKAQARSAASAP
jgi:DNA-binding GntR family transcriptional regulator